MGARTELAIETAGLTKRFGNVEALVDLTLQVRKGCLFGFLGPNGAGKTTTLRLLTGLLRPTAGSARVLGYDVVVHPLEIKRRIGVVFDEPALYEYLTPREFLRFVGEAYRLPHREIERRSERLLEFLTLTDKADALCRELSHGMRHKLDLAAALLPDPEVLFLDEPLTGIDPIDARAIKEALRTFVRRGGTVFLSSHVLDVVERLCDEVGILHRGRLLAQGDLETLRERVRSGGREAETLEDVFLRLVGAGPKGGWIWD